MKTYTYKGKNRSAAGGRLLNPEATVELSEKDPHVKSLVAKGLLEVKKSKSKQKYIPEKPNSKK